MIFHDDIKMITHDNRNRKSWQSYIILSYSTWSVLDCNKYMIVHDDIIYEWYSNSCSRKLYCATVKDALWWYMNMEKCIHSIWSQKIYDNVY